MDDSLGGAKRAALSLFRHFPSFSRLFSSVSLELHTARIWAWANRYRYARLSSGQGER